MMDLPASPETRKKGREAASKYSRRRKELLQQLHDAELSIEEFLELAEKGDKAVLSTRITRLVKCFPGVGNVRAGMILGDANVISTRKVGGLGSHQKKDLVNAIYSYVPATYIEKLHKNERARSHE